MVSASSECVSERREGFYNDTTEFPADSCRQCWDHIELALHAGLELQFFALFACNTTSNDRWAQCDEEPDARFIGSDPGSLPMKRGSRARQLTRLPGAASLSASRAGAGARSLRRRRLA